MSLFGKGEKSKPAKNSAAPHPPAIKPDSKAAAPPIKAEPNALQRASEPKPGDDREKAARLSHQLHLATGQIVTVLMNEPECQKMTLENVRALVAPAIATGQFVLAMGQSKENGRVAPAAVALWASVSDEIDKRLSADLNKLSIAASEWRSGPHAWLIMVAGDRRILKPLLTQFQKTTLKGAILKMRVAGKDGKVSVQPFSPQAPSALS